ncbi:MAG: CvpA family protein [Chloroflexi bacterium]|nr:CvpA family protein [Chloroflexota bacterium]
MNWLDIVIIVTMGIAALMGYRTGVIKGFLSIIGIIVGVVLAGQLGDSVGGKMTFIDNPDGATIAGYAVVFGAVFIGALILASVLRKLLDFILLVWVDNLGGAVLGVGASAIVWTGAIAAAGSFPVGFLNDAVEGSSIAPDLADKVPFVLDLLPEEYSDVLSFVEGTDLPIPTVSVSDVVVKDSSPNGLILGVTLSIDNPNRFGANLPDIEYEIYQNDSGTQTLLAASSITDVRMDANAVTDIELEWTLSAADFLEGGSAIRRILDGDSIPVTIKGVVIAKFLSITLDVPFSFDTQIG